MKFLGQIAVDNYLFLLVEENNELNLKYHEFDENIYNNAVTNQMYKYINYEKLNFYKVTMISNIIILEPHDKELKCLEIKHFKDWDCIIFMNEPVHIQPRVLPDDVNYTEITSCGKRFFNIKSSVLYEQMKKTPIIDKAYDSLEKEETDKILTEINNLENEIDENLIDSLEKKSEQVESESVESEQVESKTRINNLISKWESITKNDDQIKSEIIEKNKDKSKLDFKEIKTDIINDDIEKINFDALDDEVPTEISDDFKKLIEDMEKMNNGEYDDIIDDEILKI